MLHIDFWFEDQAGHLIVIGWSDQVSDPVRLSEATVFRTEPEFLDRHSRSDLGSSAALAFVAIFARAEVAGAPEAGALISIETGGQAKVLTDQGKGFRLLVETGVKEAYDRVLLLIAAGHIEMAFEGDCATVVKRRMANYPLGALETIQFALSVDVGLTSTEGAALVHGWFLVHKKYAACKLYGAGVSGTAISRIRVFGGQVPRPDLEGFAARYEVTGRDGFVAATARRAFAREGANVQLYLAVDLGTTTAILVAPSQGGSAQAVGRLLAASCEALGREDQRRSLLEGFLPAGGDGTLTALAEAFAAPAPGRQALCIDLDIEGDFVGDLCLAVQAQGLEVDRFVVLVDQDETATFRAVDRLMAEWAERAHGAQIMVLRRGELGACLTNLDRQGITRILYGRASLLFHLLDADPQVLAQAAGSDRAQIVVCAPRAQTAGLMAAERTGGYQPVLYAAALRPTLAALDSVPGVFMTSEAGFKFIAASLPAQFPRHLARQERLLLGQDGSLNQPFLWGRNAYTVDSQALSVLFRAGSGT